MRYRSLWAICMGLLLSVPVWAEQPPPQREDFAWGIDLQIEPGKAIYRLPLPRTVYEGVVRADLGDLAVFNAKGQLVPHDLRRHPVDEPVAVEQRTVGLFPIYGERDANLQTLSLQLVSPLETGELRLRSQSQIRSQHTVLRGHILTLRTAEQKQSVATLQLEWPTDSRGFVQRLRVEQSNDLNRWRRVQGDVVVADLRHNGEQLRKERISLGGVSGRYLRLTPLGKGEAVPFSQARIELTQTRQPRQTQQWWLDAVTAGAVLGEYLFELPPALSLASINVIPTQSNSFARVALHSRSDQKGPWRQRTAGLIYNLMTDGAVVQQTNLSIGAVNARYWRLQVDMGGGGFGAAPPQIAVSWLPHDLLFTARGQGPFVLAYGSARMPKLVTSGRLQQMPMAQQASLVGDRVSVGAPYVLGGRGVLQPAHEVAWKQWLLWGVLILASLLLVGMAWTTFKQMAR